jgi:hypothetical protein
MAEIGLLPHDNMTKFPRMNLTFKLLGCSFHYFSIPEASTAFPVQLCAYRICMCHICRTVWIIYVWVIQFDYCPGSFEFHGKQWSILAKHSVIEWDGCCQPLVWQAWLRFWVGARGYGRLRMPRYVLPILCSEEYLSHFEFCVHWQNSFRISCTIIAPTPLVAANFVILGMIIDRVGDHYSRLTTKQCEWNNLNSKPLWLNSFNRNRHHDFLLLWRYLSDRPSGRGWNGLSGYYPPRRKSCMQAFTIIPALKF